MLNSKFYLYKTEWLDLVFDNRNKEYGAYDLRKHYANNMVKAMGIAFFSVIVLFVAHGVLFKPTPIAEVPRTIPDIPIIQLRSVKPHIIEPPKAAITHPHTQVSATKYPVLVATRDDHAVEPPKITELQTTAIGPATVSGKNDGANEDLPITTPGNGTAPPAEDNTPKTLDAVEVAPEPKGGADAWSKFLQKNIRYPAQAVDAGKSGRVWVSFIVEKDGHLSNFTVDRGAGFGMDEEALRVLKLAPAWKPGIQNGHAVRVKYNIPINFQLNDE